MPHSVRGTRSEPRLPSRLAWSDKASGRKVGLGGGQQWPESLLGSTGLGDVAEDVSLGGNWAGFIMCRSDGHWPGRRKEVTRLVSAVCYCGVGLER